MHRGPASEEAPCRPDSAYGENKLAAEEAAATALATALAGSPVRLVVLRLSVVYGPGIGGNIARLVRMAWRGVLPGVAPGLVQKSLLFVDDLAPVCAALLDGGPSREVLNVASGPPHTVREIVRAIADAAPGRVRALWVPAALAWAAVVDGSSERGAHRREPGRLLAHVHARSARRYRGRGHGHVGALRAVRQCARAPRRHKNCVRQ